MAGYDAVLGTGMMALIGAFFFGFLLILLAIYIYSSLALMAIAKKTKTNNPWLAWIPIANFYLMMDIAKAPMWSFVATLIGIFLTWIPILGGLISLGIIGIMLWWWWKIAEARKRPGWLGILMIIPIANLIVMGVLAWGD